MLDVGEVSAFCVEDEHLGRASVQAAWHGRPQAQSMRSIHRPMVSEQSCWAAANSDAALRYESGSGCATGDSTKCTHAARNAAGLATQLVAA